MSIDFAPGPVDNTPQSLRDQAIGRADAYDAHQAGTDLGTLADRLDWMDDPRVSAYSAAYLDGYRAYLSDMSASQWWVRQSQTAIAFNQREQARTKTPPPATG